MVEVICLDLSTAFDIIDRSIILHDYLKDWYGIGGVVLKWVESYLISRKQKIQIDRHFSVAFQSPQGSTRLSLGPMPGVVVFIFIFISIQKHFSVYLYLNTFVKKCKVFVFVFKYISTVFIFMNTFMNTFNIFHYLLIFFTLY